MERPILPAAGNRIEIEIANADARELGRHTRIEETEPNVPSALVAEDRARWVHSKETAADAGVRGRGRRLAIAALSTLGFVDSLYMLAYEEGLIDSLACPFFGEGCEIVGRSEAARHFGVPNAAVGALAYGAMATLSLWQSETPRAQRPWQARALTLLAGGAALASALLTHEQARKVRAWCFWCLLSAAINAALLPLALAGPFGEGRGNRK